MAFAASMAALGVAGRLDSLLAASLEMVRPEGGFRNTPIHWIWPGALAHALMMAVVLLHTPGWWRRWLFSAAALVVTAGWAPVLALAAWQPAVSVPLLVVITSAAGSLLYIARHHMPNDLADHETR